MKYSIIIPIYNEVAHLEKLLPQLLRQLSVISGQFEIILSENGSTDDTLLIAKKLAAKQNFIHVIHAPIANYGLAVKHGFLKARGEYLVLFDIDYWSVSFIHKANSKLSTADAVIGSKLSLTSKDTRHIHRRAATRIFATILKLFFSSDITDTHGIKILNRHKFLPIIKRCKFTREIFDTELLIRAEQDGLKIAEVSVIVRERRASRTSIFIRTVRTLADLIKLKRQLASE